MRANHPDWFPDLPDDGNFNRRARSLLPLLNASLRHLTADVDTLVALLDTSGLSVVKLARATRRRLFREDDVFPARRDFRSPPKQFTTVTSWCSYARWKGCPSGWPWSQPT
jgi:hypothetical protein